MIDLLIVAFNPRIEELISTFNVLHQARQTVPLGTVHIWHNDDGESATPGLREAYAAAQSRGLHLSVLGTGQNLGFGAAINQVWPTIRSTHLLILNQDAVPEPGAIEKLANAALADEPGVAAWEMRQIPYEHPKHYDPITRTTDWCSGAAVLLRIDALRSVGGFEPRIFMYCEDVDLCWRLRSAGWKLRYEPKAAVVHRTYEHAGAVKPLMVLESAYANLCLRARYGSYAQLIEGLKSVIGELRGPEGFPGHRQGLRRALLRFAANAFYFRRTRPRTRTFKAVFNGRDYEARREGAFLAFLSQAERPGPLPTTAVILRANNDPLALQRHLVCLAGQTHPVTEVHLVGQKPAPTTQHEANVPPHLLLIDARTEDGSIEILPALDASPARWYLLLDASGPLSYADQVEVLLQEGLARAETVVCGLTASTVGAPGTVQADPTDQPLLVRGDQMALYAQNSPTEWNAMLGSMGRQAVAVDKTTSVYLDC